MCHHSQRVRVQVAKELGIPVLDVWTLFKNQEDWRALLSDGLHLTVDGNCILFNGLKTIIHSQIPEILPDALPLDMPLQITITDSCKHEEIIRPYVAKGLD
jgi:hypothetical protein